MGTQYHNEIIDNLFISNDNHALNEGHTYDLIVNCTKALPFDEKIDETHTSRIRVSVNDVPDDALLLFQLMRDTNTLEVIDDHLKNGKRVLVHCVGGIQRSPSVVVCYLIKYHEMTTEKAISFVRSKRQIAFLFNIVNFVQTFEEYQNYLLMKERMKILD